ncbi:acetyl-CoA carboxylase biotin carboxyl carrier protein subunit [soil metagenome]
MYKVTVNKKKNFIITGSKDQRLIDEQKIQWDVVKIEENSFHILSDNKSFRAEIIKADFKKKLFILRINGNKFEVSLQDKSDLLLEKLGLNTIASSGIKEIKAPMPGLILEIKVNEGDKVNKGDSLMVLEAMKMENVLKSTGDGIVKSIKVKKGESVEKNQILILF